MKFFKRLKNKNRRREKFGTGFTEVVDVAEHLVEGVTHDAERLVQPISKRYPTLFLILVTFGFVSTLYGFERVIHGIPFLGERPFLILLIGIATLVLTGTLYKKLR